MNLQRHSPLVDFIPRLVELWRQGRLPVERMIETFDFDQIDEAALRAQDGLARNAVLQVR